MRFISLLILLVSFTSCEKKRNSFSEIEVLGHAAMGLDMANSIYHDNSKEAIDFALNMPGSNGIEIDVQMDADGELWLFHDEVLDKETNGFGCIAEKTTNEMDKLQYSSIHKEKIARLDVVNFEEFPTKTIFLDIRNFVSCSNSYVDVSKLIQGLKKLNLDSLANCKLIIPSASWLGYFENDFQVYLGSDDIALCQQELQNHPQTKGIVIRSQSISYSQIFELIAQNYEIYLFEMRSPKGIKEGFLKNPTGIITDDLRTGIIEKSK